MGANDTQELTPLKFLVDEQEETKTYHATAAVFLKRDLDITAVPGWSLVSQGPTPVYEDDKLVGAASIRWGDYGDLICDLFFEYASQARLSAQIDDKIFAAPRIAINIDRAKKQAFIEVKRIDLVRSVPVILSHTRIHAYTGKA